MEIYENEDRSLAAFFSHVPANVETAGRQRGGPFILQLASTLSTLWFGYAFGIIGNVGESFARFPRPVILVSET
jgi:hypothetical protein